MSIPPFPRRIEISDFEYFLRTRLSQKIVYWPQQAIPLVGYMGWPDDPDARAEAASVLGAWAEGSQAVPRGLGQLQADWARVTDILSLHYELTAGDHQQRRGGPSIGKAIAVAAGSIRARGARAANLWRAWKAYKDVAHLVTAATAISVEARHLAKLKPFGKFGFEADELQPFPIAMLVPDFVMSVALSFQDYGLSSTPQAREEPTLDPDALWRIGPDLNVVAAPPPIREISKEAIAILNARRAGNRGKASKTTPVAA